MNDLCITVIIVSLPVHLFVDLVFSQNKANRVQMYLQKVVERVVHQQYQ